MNVASVGMVKRNEDGYRYVREERTWPTALGVVLGERVVVRWATYERRNGRAQRVGTCDSYEDVLRFLARSTEHTKGKRGKAKGKN